MKQYLVFFLFLLELALPSAAQPDTVFTLEQPLPTEDAWWDQFADPMLPLLIRKAVANNYDLQNAIRNIGIARARWRIQQGRFYPSVTASAQYTPEKSSLGIDHTELYSRVGQAGVEMNWEIDVFGSIRKSAQAQKEYYLASIEDYRGTMVSLAAEVASGYIRLRTYQRQLEVAYRNVQSQQEVLDINEAKFQTGLASSLVVAQSRGLLLQTQATIPGIEASIYSEASNLAVLMGEYSDSLRQALLVPDSLLRNPGLYMQGIPAELIRRRPDVRSAERNIDALAAAAGASRADWWPKFYLKGAFGFGNKYFEHFFQKKNMTWQISPSVQWTIFSGRQAVENSRLAQLQLDEGINSFNQTLLTALQEVDDAILSYNKSLQQLQADREALTQIRLTLQYAIDLYQRGLTDYQSVLDSQRNVFQYENVLVNSESTSLLYLVQLYRALGGGYGENEGYYE